MGFKHLPSCHEMEVAATAVTQRKGAKQDGQDQALQAVPQKRAGPTALFPRD